MKFFHLFLIINFSLYFSTNASENYDCRKLSDIVEKKNNLPNKLLSSISITESGYLKNGIYAPWPWTLNINGKPKFFENKAEMTNFLNKKLSQNIKNIDIGCMQINYFYHSKNFNEIDDMIDPQTNVQYAGKFLKKLFKKHKSWNKAISFYHSSDPQRMKNYLKKVKKNWDIERQRKRFKDKSDNLNEANDSTTKKILFFREILKDEKPLYM